MILVRFEHADGNLGMPNYWEPGMRWDGNA
jgi:hypothetical protein